jgi:hypothetical protein
MSDYAAGWLDRLRPEFAAYARAALDNIGREALEGNFPRWLPLASYPLRTGVHTNSAFGISRALPYADRQPGGDLSRALRAAAGRWYGADADCPGAWEPSGQACRFRPAS